jgi:hypothetical protein
MKAVEFQGTVAPDGHIAVPPEVASKIPPGENLHVVVTWDEPDFDLAWRTAGRERFEAAYSPEDAVYEQLMDDSAIR